MRVTRSAVVGTLLLFAAGAPAAYGQTFALQVGPPAAAMPDPSGRIEKKVGKDVVFVLRSSGCPDPASVKFSATAEAVVGGVRRTWPLPIGTLTTGGIFAAAKTWLDRTPWVAMITATCGDREAGAAVRIINDTYRREGVELFSRRPTPADLERALGLLAKDEAASTPSR